MFALVDGNNFYVSCERAFRPALVGRPVVVLSNNDGCAIARSNEAKALGVKMGQPWFECRHLEAEHGLLALSSNFTLYGDMSDRMMTIASSFAPRSENYSIDELFLAFDGIRCGPAGLTEIGRTIRARVLQWTGIPTCVGFGPTKTLAKLANHIAKTAERKPGTYPAELAQVCNFGAMTPGERDALFAQTAVNEVWGVGPRITRQLLEAGVATVLDLVRIDSATIRRRFSVVMEKTVLELRGTRCLSLEDAPAPKQQIMCSRSFGTPVLELDDLVEAVSEFAARASEKLRSQSHLAGAVLVFITTNPFKKNDRQYGQTITVPMIRPSCDSNAIVGSAVAGLRRIYRPGFRYAKAGVMLVELQPETVHQGELDLELESPGGRDRGRLMSAVDAVNKRYGRGALTVASTGTTGDRRLWTMKQERRTPHYTTSWADIPVVRA